MYKYSICILLSDSEFDLPELSVVLCYASKYHSLCMWGSFSTVNQCNQVCSGFCVE